MATVLRIKRKREDQPLPSLVLSTQLSNLSSSSTAVVTTSSSTNTLSTTKGGDQPDKDSSTQNDRPLRFRRLCSWDPNMSRKENVKKSAGVGTSTTSSSSSSFASSNIVPILSQSSSLLSSSSSPSTTTTTTVLPNADRMGDYTHDGIHSMPLLPNNVASAVRAAWEVQETRKNVAKRQQQQQQILSSASSLSSTTTTTTNAGNKYSGFVTDTEENTVEASFQQQYNLVSTSTWANRQTVPIRVFDIITSLSSSTTTTTIPPSGETSPSMNTMDTVDTTVTSSTASENSSSVVTKFPTVKLLRRWDAVPIHYSSLPPISPSSSKYGGGKGGVSLSSTKTTNTNAKPILNPFERQMDEAIWRCFRTGDIQGIYTSLRNGGDVNFYRKHDHTTALMGAAFHGDELTVLYLLKQRAYAHWKDTENRTAADYAAINHHYKLANMLRDTIYHELVSLGLIDGENYNYGGSNDSSMSSAVTMSNDEEVYDIYILDNQPELTSVSSSITSSMNASLDSVANNDTPISSPFNAPLIPPSTFYLDPVSFAIARDAALGGPSGWDLVYENSYINKEDDEDYDSEDSNIEDAPGNDYPEERNYRLLRKRRQLKKKNALKKKDMNGDDNDNDDDDNNNDNHNNNEDTDSFDANDDDDNDDDSALDDDEDYDTTTGIHIDGNYEEELMAKINQMILESDGHNDNSMGDTTGSTTLRNPQSSSQSTTNNDDYEI